VNAVEVGLIGKMRFAVSLDGAVHLVDAIFEARCHIDGDLLDACACALWQCVS
jgi:hypothetical protein